MRVLPEYENHLKSVTLVCDEEEAKFIRHCLSWPTSDPSDCLRRKLLDSLAAVLDPKLPDWTAYHQAVSDLANRLYPEDK